MHKSSVGHNHGATYRSKLLRLQKRWGAGFFLLVCCLIIFGCFYSLFIEVSSVLEAWIGEELLNKWGMLILSLYMLGFGFAGLILCGRIITDPLCKKGYLALTTLIPFVVAVSVLAVFFSLLVLLAFMAGSQTALRYLEFLSSFFP